VAGQQQADVEGEPDKTIAGASWGPNGHCG
jgi:hypothetical protein